MPNGKRESLINDNAAKAALLYERGIPHEPLLGENATNAAHREQGKKFDRLLAGAAESNNDVEPEEHPTEQNREESNSGDIGNDNPPPKPPSNPPVVAPVIQPAVAKEEPLADDIPMPLPLIAKSDQGALPTPRTVSPDELAFFFQETKQSLLTFASESTQVINELQAVLAQIGEQSSEALKLREQTVAQQAAKQTAVAVQEENKLRDMVTDLRKKLAGHQLSDDPGQIICCLKADHDKAFVTRASQISHWWKWGCISSLALLCIIVLWLAVSSGSGASPKTTEPPTSDLNLDFPALKDLK